MKRIGERIKRNRELMGLQLNDLAKKVGISSSALSQIEKAKSSPSIITLKIIAENLHTTVGELIGENESLSNNPIFRKEDRSIADQNESGSKVHLLTQKDLSKQMDTFLIEFNLNSNSHGLFKQYNGQIFCYLLSGEIQFEIDNLSYVVQPGDSLYFNGRRNFLMKNIYEGISKMVCVSDHTSK